MSLTEVGFPAVGLSGFFGFATKGGEELAPEFAAVMSRLKPARILFSGDSDTALNYQFSVGAPNKYSAEEPRTFHAFPCSRV
jgi:hypothetical protein